MSTYFHCCPVLVAEGSILLPGNWGRILKMYNRKGVGDVLMREYVLEKIREAEFPQKPSRLNCIFACPSYNQAVEYRNQTQKNTENIYEVEPIDPNALIHWGDYGKVSPADNYLSSIDECARSYWRGQNVALQEVVIGSPVKIIKRMRVESL